MAKREPAPVRPGNPDPACRTRPSAEAVQQALAWLFGQPLPRQSEQPGHSRTFLSRYYDTHEDILPFRQENGLTTPKHYLGSISGPREAAT